MIELPGLPEGIEAVEWKKRVPSGEFYLQYGQIVKSGPEPYPNPSLIVRPKDGYSFEYDPCYGCWTVVKQYPTPRLFTVTVGTSSAERSLRYLETAFPGAVTVTEQ
jgi:hypothetical protein